MFQSLSGQAAWIWIAVGVLLCAGETLAPGVFLLFIGLAAIATGLVLAVIPLDFVWALLLFAVFAAGAVWLGQRFYGSRQGDESDQPFLGRRADALVGRTYTLAESIKAGEGSLRINDTRWKIVGPDMPAGTKVRVTGVVDATILQVEQV